MLLQLAHLPSLLLQLPALQLPPLLLAPLLLVPLLLAPLQLAPLLLAPLLPRVPPPLQRVLLRVLLLSPAPVHLAAELLLLAALCKTGIARGQP